MVKNIYFDNLETGTISAILFIIMDILIIGLLDVVLTRVVCIFYFRNVNNGRPIVVKSADLPGLTHFLIGSPLSIVNTIAVLCKLALLGVIFVGNISIDGTPEKLVTQRRNATFEAVPNDTIVTNLTQQYGIQRRLDRSRFCFTNGIYKSASDDDEVPDSITYHHIRFNLANGVHVVDDPVIPFGAPPRYDIDDSSIVCLSQDETDEEDVLINVVGCTRTDLTEERRTCRSVISSLEAVRRPVTVQIDSRVPRSDGIIKFDVETYSQEHVETLIFPEYGKMSPQFTCLATELDDSVSLTRITHCLLVAFNRTGSGEDEKVQTIVERWVIESDEFNRRSFVLPYPGAVFEGLFNVTEAAAVVYLENPFADSDYESLSGDLIAQSSVYKAFPPNERRLTIRIKRGEDESAFSTISKFVIGLLGASCVVVLIAFVVTTLLVRFDKRPRFNTINGLSSIVNEEYAPSGQSYEAGKHAILGLRFTRDDKMHFGPLASYDEAARFQDGYDVS